MTRRLLSITLPAVTVLAALGACARPADSVPGSAANAAAPRYELCGISDVSVTIAAQPSTETAQTALVTLTNTGTDTCSVDGWLSIMLVNVANNQVKVPTILVDQPGPAAEVPLAGGESAYAGIKWTACAKGEAKCSAGNALRYDLAVATVGLPAVMEGFPKNRKRNNLTMRSLEIGSLQATRTGVTDW
ncbi:DUF4232 domain-containing protein [Actinoplanes aureus]|uniref:DUF4232 domain-containing protein n=1 Tax=Actinoplanes aureus TaxID=2792083 RepID=A0A931C4B2_9ACTN|nr:DUF4232 domain-containing protein [Actinoplanes aureus]MBG0563139.1 DUF4232 domain-containing protein [Actinoplanes aureus]